MSGIVLDQTIDRAVGKKLMEEYQKNRESHIPSGKLSASSLGKPRQSQILKTIGVPSREVDEYVIRKFQRGDDVEDWIVGQMPGVIERQKFVEYRNVVGYVDALVDTASYEFKAGQMCIEVKSITNAAYKWLEKDRTPKLSHSLQGALYALALGHKYYAVTYVASDDYRIFMAVLETDKFKGQVENIITDYDKCIKNHIVPVFEPLEKWQTDPAYADFPDWMNLTQDEINRKLSTLPIKWPET